MIDTKIRFSHKTPTHEAIYDVYVNEILIGKLAESWLKDKSYNFLSNNKVALSVTSRKFESLSKACEEIISKMPHWIAEAALKGIK